MEKLNKGITLIALIVTIIIMLILAAATISIIQGTNFWGTIRGAAKKQEMLQLEEEANSELAGILLDPANANLTDEQILNMIKERLSNEKLEKYTLIYDSERKVIKVIEKGTELTVSITDETTDEKSIYIKCTATKENKQLKNISYEFYISTNQDSWGESESTNNEGEYTFENLKANIDYYIKIKALSNDGETATHIAHMKTKGDLYIIDGGTMPIEVEGSSTRTDSEHILQEDSYRMVASYANTICVINTTEKIDVTNYSELVLNLDIGQNFSMPTNFIIGLCSAKECSTNFDTASQIAITGTQTQNKTIELDVSNMTGKYYIKATLIHPSVSTYTCFAFVKSFKLVAGQPNANELTIVKGNSTSGMSKTIKLENYILNNNDSGAGLTDVAYNMDAAYANNRVATCTSEKIDITQYNTLSINADLFSNNVSLVTGIYVGICNVKDNTITFANGKYVYDSNIGNTPINKTLNLDVSGITGEYYVKIVATHGPNPSAYTANVRIKNLKLTKTSLGALQDMTILDAGNNSIELETSVTSNNASASKQETCYYMRASFAGTRAAVFTKNKIDVTEYKNLIATVNMSNDSWMAIQGTFYIGLCNEKDNTITYVKCKSQSESYSNSYVINLDISDLSGEYYIKCVLEHGTYNSFTVTSEITNLKLVR